MAHKLMAEMASFCLFENICI